MADQNRKPQTPKPLGPEPISIELGDIEPVPVTPEPETRQEGENDAIRLVEPSKAGGESKVRTSQQATLGAQRHKFTRPLNVTGTGATRCRLFHSRIAVAPLEYLQGSINEWLNEEEVEVKHVGHVIGTMEGKTPEPNLIVLVWY